MDSAVASVEASASLIERGGPVLVLLLIVSVITLALILIKMMQLRGLRIPDTEFIEQTLFHWSAARGERALDVLGATDNPVARLMETAIRGQLNSDLVESRVREEVAREAAGWIDILQSHLRWLELIGNLAPLLGLLGTVLGMIEAFQAIEHAGSSLNPSVLSGGIWSALLTTAVGLAVAIPALAAAHGFERWNETYQRRMEDAVTMVFTKGPVFEDVESEEALEAEPLPGYDYDELPDAT